MVDNPSSDNSTESFFKYFTSKNFWINFGAVLGVFLLLFLVTHFWLKVYTHHGQALELPNYEGFLLAEAKKSAKKNKYTLLVKDSIHIVGKPGGLILSQDPDPFSKVKQGRTIYVAITKSQADEISLSRLPKLYGENFDRKKRELADHFEIRSKVVGQEHDPGAPGQILKVMYNGKTIVDDSPRNEDVKIEKGATLDFIISERTGGRVPIPDIVCQEYSGAKFALESLGLSIGDITYTGQVDDLNSAIIVSQTPRVGDGTIERGSSISVEVSSVAPSDCE